MIEKPEDIFAKIKPRDFNELLNLANSHCKIDVEGVYADYIGNGNKLKELYDRWEKSVSDGKYDFSVYGDEYYIEESFICWKLYSRKYLLLLKQYLNSDKCCIDNDKVKSIVDLGCGCAYTTVGLKALFPYAKVYGTNLPGTLQYFIDCYVTEKCGCEMVDERKTLELESVDLVFASEFFEHIQNPISLLRGLIETHRPEYFVFANTFTKMSLGHFDLYYNELGEVMSGKDMSRHFTKVLRDFGYEKVDTGFFNNRPQIYKLAKTKGSKLF